MSPCTPSRETATDRLASLVEELLDAHCDTLCLAEHASDDETEAHLDYLRALQRVGQRTLAELSAESRPAPVPEPSYRAFSVRSASS